MNMFNVIYFIFVVDTQELFFPNNDLEVLVGKGSSRFCLWSHSSNYFPNSFKSHFADDARISKIP